MAINNRKSQMVSMNAGYSLPDAMREDVGYKSCWVCPDEESAIAFMKNMKAEEFPSEWLVVMEIVDNEN